MSQNGLRASICLFVISIVITPLNASAELVARQITVETAEADLFLGSDAVGGVGDWYLSNGIVQAVIDNVGFQQDVLDATGERLPITSLVAPSGGTVIDLGLVGKNNDQLDQIAQIANFDATNPIIYGPASGDPASPPILASVDPNEGVAKLTVFGFVLIPGISTPEDPTLSVQTEYSLRSDEAFLRIKTTVLNNSSTPVPLFNIVDVMLLGQKANLPFAVFPGRGFNHPALDLDDLAAAFGTYPYVSVIGRVSPTDGPIDSVAMVPADEVSYTILSPPGLLFGVNSDLISATGNAPEPLPPGTSRIYERRVIVGDRNDVAASADLALQQLSQVFGFPIGKVQGQLIASDGIPFRASAEITQIDLNPLTPEPETLLSDLVNDISPLPLTQVLTDSDHDGKFEAIVPAGLYELNITPEERDDTGPIPFLVLPGETTDLDVIPLAKAASLRVTVVPPGPAKITIKGDSDTLDPDFGVPLNFTIGGERLRTGADVSSPALNAAFTATGQVETTIRPGTYNVFASRGIEHTVDSRTVTITPGKTKHIRLRVRRAIATPRFVSADFHIHGARSSDASTPPRDRVISYAAEGVEVMVSSDHDFIFDYQPIIEELGLTRRVTAMVGNEVSTINIGHFNGWPLEVRPNARRDGAPEDEFVEPNILYDRLRERGASVVQVNHPEDGDIGLFSIIGFDPNQPIDSPPNAFLLQKAITGSGTRNIDFDVFEIYNGRSIPDYILSRQDWFNLLNQGFLKTATAVSDSHRIVAQHAGFPRTYVESRTRDLRRFDSEAFNRNLKSMRAMGTSGPFVSVKVIGAKQRLRNSVSTKGLSDVGRLVRLSRGRRPRLLIVVQAAPWIPVEEIRVYANGQLIKRRPVASTRAAVRFFDTVSLPSLTQDTYIVVEAGQVLPEDPTVQPPSIGLMNVIEPGVVSLAFTNPVFIDVNRNGRFDPPDVMPDPVDQTALRSAMHERTPVEAYWQHFWSRFQMPSEQIREALDRMDGEATRP